MSLPTCSTIPLHLQDLFDTMNFIASAMKDEKPCFFSRIYVDRSSLFGSFYRWLKGEKQSIYGNSKIRACCESAAQALDSYKNTFYEDMIVQKMLKLRRGLVEITATYSKQQNEIDTVNHLEDSISIIDLKLSDEIKIKYGILAPKPVQIPNQTLAETKLNYEYKQTDLTETEQKDIDVKPNKVVETSKAAERKLIENTKIIEQAVESVKNIDSKTVESTKPVEQTNETKKTDKHKQIK